MAWTIAVDLDSVCNDLINPWLDWYNIKYIDDLVEDDIIDWNINQFAKCGNEIYDFLKLPGTFKLLPPRRGAKRGMGKLCRFFDVAIVTAYENSGTTVMEDKLSWIETHFPFFNTRNVIFCNYKSFIKADYMLDDGLHNLEHFCGQGVLYDRPWNRKCDIYPRVYNWIDVVEYFMGELGL
jgi:5'(3')-deoxyribonucleotidase